MYSLINLMIFHKLPGQCMKFGATCHQNHQKVKKERQKGSNSHQKHQKVKIVRKKRSHFGVIFDHFRCKKWSRKVSPFQSRLLKALEWFWSSFWYHFRSFLIWFLALTKSAFLMTLPSEINDFAVRNGMKKTLNSKSFSIRLLEASFEAKLIRNGSKVEQNLIKISSKTWSKNRCIFGRRWIAVGAEP